MMKKIFIFLIGFLIAAPMAHANVTIESFQIFPNALFTDDDAGVIFTVKVSGVPSERPKEITLIEVDATGQQSRYRWALLDDGTQGDLQAGDGIYTRTIQFKEKKSKDITFLVISESSELGSVHQPLPVVGPLQVAKLEIKNRPSMLEILSQVIEKVRSKK